MLPGWPQKLQFSMVCKAHLQSYSTSYLPYERHLTLSREDIAKIHCTIQKYLSMECLKKISKLSATNRTESMHNRVFTYALKHNNWSRNWQALCHSAVHSASLGTGRSILKIAKSIGIKVQQHSPFCKSMMKLDRQNQYFRQRQMSLRCKAARYHLRKCRANRTDTSQLQMSCYAVNMHTVCTHAAEMFVCNLCAFSPFQQTITKLVNGEKKTKLKNWQNM